MSLFTPWGQALNVGIGANKAAVASFNAADVRWRDAVLAIALLIVVLVATLVSTMIGAPPPFAVLRDLSIATILADAIPFVVLLAFAAMRGVFDRAAYISLYVALLMILVHIVLFVFSYFGADGSTGGLGVTGLMLYRGARNILGFPIWLAVLAAAIAVIGIFLSGLLLLLLPSGPAILGGA